MSLDRNVTATFNSSNQSAFGDLISQELNPVIQLGFEYLDTALIARDQNLSITNANGGSADRLNGRLRLQTNTTANGITIVKSKKPAKYRQGQGGVIRFTKVFATGITNNIQITGVGNNTDGYFFGYNGTSFGILHRSSSSGSLVNTWIAQSSWNGDTMNGTGSSGVTLDTTKGNAYQIIYPHLGFGAIQFFVLKADNSWIKVHTIQYPNANTNIEVLNPNFYYWDENTNSGGITTNVTNYTGSVGIFRSGYSVYLGSKFATNNNKAVTSGTPLNIFTIKNATSYNGVENSVAIRINFVSIAFGNLANNAFGTVEMVKNPTLTTPSFAAKSGTTADGGTTITAGNSVASIDTAGTYTASSGIAIWNVNGANNSNFTNDVTQTKAEYLIFPGETVSFIASVTANASVSVAVNWVEDI